MLELLLHKNWEVGSWLSYEQGTRLLVLRGHFVIRSAVSVAIVLAGWWVNGRLRVVSNWAHSRLIGCSLVRVVALIHLILKKLSEHSHLMS